jgi:hypothetical protein
MGRPLADTRGWFELARILADPVLYGVGVQRGDGRPVVLMPGFLAGDQTLMIIAAWLQRIGYRPQLCGFVANADFRAARSPLLFGVFEVEAAVAPPGHGGVGEVGAA